ncbi:SusC/RagA family TonB-linked outer membrane protein [Chitinophaga qingshengii]|uniref:SusC/RagA family TonB-linked outer membrane protein n=1 Tax=Chitinophaga qingshengii TaxID=1569794 RepID=A0ABR7TPD5_9BACT|nr:SusC/RagA family TonB-linked outer membrane protein [Chitinophaga qingshengii]MBC9931845.1 SusC/RagA family TonB-linked outer membrane protein [Chitinophaga qingshengii]
MQQPTVNRQRHSAAGKDVLRRSGCFGSLLLSVILPAVSLSAQTVTLSANRMPLEKVCKEVEKQTGYYFVYPANLRQNNPLVTVALKNADVNTSLREIFDRTSYRYEVTDKVVSINTALRNNKPEKNIAAKDTLSITVKGRVTSLQTFGPLENASVSSSFTQRTTLTNEKGEFELKGVLLGEEILVSYVGYEKYKAIVTQPTVNVMMQPADNLLDKVVVKAYGVTSKRFNTSSIVTVSGKELQDLPVQNPLMALEGRVPGLMITRANNSPGSPLRVEVRGRNGINGLVSSDPLFVIDGVPQTVLDVQPQSPRGNANIISDGLDQSGMGRGLNMMFGLGVNDIESIEVLKDAGATAIYGSRGANGVILITTKKTQQGKTRFSMNMSQGIKTAVKYQPYLNTKDYLAMRRQAYANSGLTPSPVPGQNGYAPELYLMDTTRYTDWQRYMYGGTGLYTTVNPRLTGGTATSSYMVSGTYTRQTDITPSSARDQSASVLLKLDNRSLNNRFKSSLSAMYINSVNSSPGNLGSLGNLRPHEPEAYDSLGKLNWVEYKRVGQNYPFKGLRQNYVSTTNRINAGFSAGYTVMDGLELSAQIGYNSSFNSSDYLSPMSAEAPKSVSGSIPTGQHSAGSTNISNLTVEPKLNWNKPVGNGVLNLLAGGTYQSNTTKSNYIGGIGYLSDDMIRDLSAAPSINVRNNVGQYKYVGVFGSLDYNLAGRYMVTLSGRRDGSSRFGPGKQFGNFWAIAAGWIMSEESWVRKWLPAAVSFLKLRGSYGLTGSDGVGDYQYLSQWAYPQYSDGIKNTPLKYNGVAPLMETIVANDQFHWQTNKKLELALEFSMWDKINIIGDWYRNRCDDQLLGYPLPLFTGFNTITANTVANVQNAGVDLMVNAELLKRKDINWSISFNINRQFNKLLAYPGLELSPYATLYRVGESLNAQALFHFLGRDPKTGEGHYQDLNGDGKINYNYGVAPGTADDDRAVFLDMNPAFSGGFQTSFRYKGWRISPSFSFIRVIKPIGYMAYGTELGNMSYWQLEHQWSPDRPDGLLPPMTAVKTTEPDRFYNSDANYKMINVFRLKGMLLSWNMPQAWLTKARMSQLAFTLNADNLWLLTNYHAGVDPDISGAVPSIRTVTLGCNISF